MFVKSLTGESVRTYPMPVWLALEERLSHAPSTHPARTRFLDRVNYYGQTGEIDNQGRVVIHPRLRESAGMSGEVDVLGTVDRLDVWNHERLVARMQNAPFTDDDARARSERGTWARGWQRSTSPSWCPRRSRSSRRRAAACSSTARSGSAGTAGHCSRPARRGSSGSIATLRRSRSRA